MLGIAASTASVDTPPYPSNRSASSLWSAFSLNGVRLSSEGNNLATGLLALVPGLYRMFITTLAIGLVVACGAFWASNLIMLPGNWFAVALLAVYAAWGPEGGRAEIGWGLVAVAFGLAAAGELVEFLAGAVGASRAGASRRSTLFALIGSMLGATAGLVVGIPVPVLGPVLAAILFGGLGAAAGAMFGEYSRGRQIRENWAIGQAAFWGRTFGTLGKTSIGAGIVLIALFGVLL